MPKKSETADLSWEDAVQRVLSEADGALHYAEIAERITSGNLRQNIGATPASTVAAILSTSLSKGEKSPYLRVGRGEYALKIAAAKNAQVASSIAEDTDQGEGTGALRAFGMFWQRGAVLWLGKPQLLGRQGAGATTVNFAGQIGVYLLHDRERVIYVGRAVDTLFARLKAHTADRLGGRWDRFSWFGLRSVRNNGELSNNEVPWSQNVVIETMEALLIEKLGTAIKPKAGRQLLGSRIHSSARPAVRESKEKSDTRGDGRGCIEWVDRY